MIVNILDSINKHLIDLAKNSDRDYSHFHPSEWDSCKRRIAYAFYESKNRIKVDDSALKIDPKSQRIFGNGHGMHDRWRRYLEATGSLMGVWECENWLAHPTPKLFGKDKQIGCSRPSVCECGSKRFKYHELGYLDGETLWGGHVDSIVDQKAMFLYLGLDPSKILPDEEYIVVDFKTMNTYEFKNLDKPKPNHNTQIQIYLFLSGLKYGKFIYEDKNTQEVKEFLVKRDENLIGIKKAEALNLKETVNSPNAQGKWRLPPRGFSSRTNYVCMGCKYRGHCWSEKHEQSKQVKQDVQQQKQLVPLSIGGNDV